MADYCPVGGPVAIGPVAIGPVAIGPVAIIGAGIAGLSCARVLSSHGLQVTVFEKSRGPGGRMSTRRTQQGERSWQCDHGAQYFTARHPLFVEQVRQWQAASVIAPWQPRIVSVGQRTSPASAPSPTSQRYVGVPRMTAPARWLAQDMDVRAGTRIIALARHADGWWLTREHNNDPTGPFGSLILAVPAQQAAELLRLLPEQQTSGDHTLRQLADLCDSYALRPCWALMLHYNHKIETDFDAAFVNPVAGNDAIISWLARDSSKPGRLNSAGETWLVHATPQWSSQHLEVSEEQVTTHLLSEFRRLSGITAEPAALVVHRWRYAQTGRDDAPTQQTWLHGHNLGLCGDWLEGGRVEGAWLSGYQLAQQILSRPATAS